MIDDLVKLEAPEGTFAVDITFHMNSEEDVMREAGRRGKAVEVFYLPNEAERTTVIFTDGSSGVMKTFVARVYS